MVFEAVVGSHAYGTNHEMSDQDVRGIYVETLEELLSLAELPKQYGDEKGDTVYYSLRRFLQLASAANPNILELLFLPEELIRRQHSCLQPILENRDAFITKKAYSSHVGYAAAQIKKARGKNKWINNPQPQSAPRLIDFCWFVPLRQTEQPPFRPLELLAAEVDLERCHASSLEHAPNVFRLYDYGDRARGVLRDGRIVTESIPLNDENERCIGLLIYNEQAHQRAVSDHRHYWEWRRNRNESRWTRQEDGNFDYDAKNMMHMMRLLMSAREILESGRPLVRFSGDRLGYLKRILAGGMSYEQIVGDAEALQKELADAFERCRLPSEPDLDRIQRLLTDVTHKWSQENG